MIRLALLLCMMFFGLLGQGVASVVPCHSTHAEQHEGCCEEKHATPCCGAEDTSVPCNDQCPDTPHHHHHGTCCHGVPSWILPDMVALVIGYGESRVALHATDEVVPEGPVRALDKPPLI